MQKANFPPSISKPSLLLVVNHVTLNWFFVGPWSSESVLRFVANTGVVYDAGCAIFNIKHSDKNAFSLHQATAFLIT